MTYGIKVAKQGQSVDDVPAKTQATTEPKPPLGYILYGVALPYLYGCRLQIERYKIATAEQEAVKKVYGCLHEASCMFEDLATVVRYAELAGDDHETHQLWRDIRNHIRHDVREGMDTTDESDLKRKNARAKRLGIDDKLQMNIGFETNQIKVGSTIVELIDIEEYLAWAEKTIEAAMIPAIDAGRIKGMSYVGQDDTQAGDTAANIT